MNPPIQQLLDTADRLLMDEPTAMGKSRYRGAAFALRIALESAVCEVLLASPLAVGRTSARAMFLCLRGHTDAETARRAKAVWRLLCLGCHYHQYEIGPSAEQVRSWRREVHSVIALVST
ncbi:hypothetical protein [Streptomyces sp. RKAG290]|uniref:hypothetical protein n=1 Tax=Streptomyces TaxID=1883 RepID=UPI002033DBD6|nr:hypothetical protein [Streptomyces sp. RKAG290]MCM2413218.1 hypothetical protein [Streptomyces sp. RKAG290]